MVFWAKNDQYALKIFRKAPEGISGFDNYRKMLDAR